MGSWGPEIMAGDTPLDILGDIKDICKTCTNDDDAWFEDLTIDELNSNMVEITEKFKNSMDEDIIRVLAYLIVTTGANMPQFIKDSIDSAIDIERLEDWKCPEERSQCLENLREAVKSYKDGNPVNLDTDIGLLPKIFQGLQL